ncbi:hypothetical protein EYF80_054086 [Liparis tanakae]|uniref:Uncharacterized protein n=1 Tax=Liparis tanakae TaxID=230148 RepID=A0A4Z2F3X3_9TELE|nr:hypothetical protein EYF80_054086 [Liparis tanakae]
MLDCRGRSEWERKEREQVSRSGGLKGAGLMQGGKKKKNNKKYKKKKKKKKKNLSRSSAVYASSDES